MKEFRIPWDEKEVIVVKGKVVLVFYDRYSPSSHVLLMPREQRIEISIGLQERGPDGILSSILHEIGHLLDDVGKSWEEIENIGMKRRLNPEYTFLEEILAWVDGFKFWLSNGLRVPQRLATDCICSLCGYLADIPNGEPKDFCRENMIELFKLFKLMEIRYGQHESP